MNYICFILYFAVFSLQPVWYEILPSASVISIRKGASIYGNFFEYTHEIIAEKVSCDNAERKFLVITQRESFL